MPRLRYFLLLSVASCGITFAQQSKPAETQEPPEEDESLAVKKHGFNPLQAEKEMKVGDYYFKKGNYQAAAGRFQEAAQWNPGLADAWFRLGEAQDKLNDGKAAKQAWARFLELAPKDKRAPDVRKRLERYTARK